MTAVIANRLEDLTDENRPRAYLVEDRADFTLESILDVCEAISTVIDRGNQESICVALQLLATVLNPLQTPLSDLASGSRMDVLIRHLCISLNAVMV